MLQSESEEEIQVKRLFALTISAILFISFSGCDAFPLTQSVLWVVTEQSTLDGMNYQVRQAVAAFKNTHSGTTVKIDILPTDEDGRSLYLRQLRTQIMAGGGPDVYLLPTGSTLILSSTVYDSVKAQETLSVEPLFYDIEQSMRQGVFADLMSYYENDTELHTEGLRQEIMDSGVLRGKRYVLPLRYTMSVLLADHANSFTQTLDLDAPILELMQQCLSEGNDDLLAGICLPTDLSAFPRVFDYDRGELLISAEDIAQYMRIYQQVVAAASPIQTQMVDAVRSFALDHLYEMYHGYFSREKLDAELSLDLRDFNSLRSYILIGSNWTDQGIPLFSTSLTGAFDSGLLKEGKQLQTETHPIIAQDGSVNASVTYFGAVGAGCDDVSLAYAFLRLFLTEEYQWEQMRPFENEGNRYSVGYVNSGQTIGWVENSWPVRAMGAAGKLYRTVKHQMNQPDGTTGYRDRRHEIATGITEVNDEDMPILQIKIDNVLYPFYQTEEETLHYALSLLNGEDGTPTNEDISKLAQQVYQYLWWNLAEG